MNVASLENCKRLYELSGWEDSLWHNQVCQARDGAYSWSVSDREGGYEHYPAYSAGYLLRKLPGYAVLKHVDEEHAIDGDTFWKAIYQSSIEGKWIEAKGCDTPEDALALLAIRLFEEGVLKKLKK